MTNQVELSCHEEAIIRLSVPDFAPEGKSFAFIKLERFKVGKKRRCAITNRAIERGNTSIALKAFLVEEPEREISLAVFSENGLRLLLAQGSRAAAEAEDRRMEREKACQVMARMHCIQCGVVFAPDPRCGRRRRCDACTAAPRESAGRRFCRLCGNHFSVPYGRGSSALTRCTACRG